MRRVAAADWLGSTAGRRVRRVSNAEVPRTRDCACDVFVGWIEAIACELEVRESAWAISCFSFACRKCRLGINNDKRSSRATHFTSEHKQRCTRFCRSSKIMLSGY